MGTKDFGYIPTTAYEVYKNHPEIKVEGLYYFDDDKNKVTPSRVWFSCDSRNWKQDAAQGPGRAYTMYFSERYGTCLAPVFLPNGKQYIYSSLCNITGDYKNGVISNFRKD
jgi:hypothetical protein